jgi:hypothetical protein
MRTRHTLIALLAAGTLAAGCGDDDGGDRATAEAPRPDPAKRAAQLERDPYEVSCADIHDRRVAHAMRAVQNSLAYEAKIRGLNQLQSSQSIYFAMTELCKSKPGSHRPAEAAVASVRSGEYRADLGSP